MSSKFLQNYSKIIQIQIFSDVSSKYSWSFHKISLKYFKKPPGNDFKNHENFLTISAVFFNTKNLPKKSPKIL